MKRIYLLFILVCFGDCVVLPSIPGHLLQCYRGGGPALGAPRRIDVLLSLIRKLEINAQLDMRMFSTALLRSLRLDGIERAADVAETDFVLPYRASAFQFHKYKLLMDLLLPSMNQLEVDDSLLLEEKCLLHRMISSSVQQWERGDENVVCPRSAEQRQSMVTEGNNRIHSRCPIEDGVVLTDWGTIAPGTVIAAIASSLEAQTVLVTDILNANLFKDVAEPLLVSAKQEWFEDIETLAGEESQRQIASPEVSNIWVATLAGDLSEVVINQGPRVGAAPQRMSIGSNNRWNDTLLPRNHYLITQNASIVDWHFTDAEILAGIDGLILAHYVPQWVEQRRTLRLAQVIDMYYSNEGVSFNPSVKACNRQSLFGDIFNNTDLLAQTTRFAHILSLRQITVYIPVEEMERFAAAAATAFENYVPNLLRENQRPCQLSYSLPVMDLVVATDASWKGYDVEQFMSWVGGALELDLQRSTLGLLHGNTGQWIVPPSENLTAVFSHLSNFTDQWPTRLSIPSIISSTIQHSMNKTLNEVEKKASAGPSTVVLMVTPSDRPSASELERARELMGTLRTTYFDVYFAYTSRELTDFQNINNEYLDYSELFLTTASNSVQDVINTVDTYVVKSEIATRIMGVHCPVNETTYSQVEYEDFVLPSRSRLYRIHPYYLRQQPLISVQFRCSGQGRLMICTWRGAESSHNCQTISDREMHTFNVTTPCPSPEFCLPIHYSVSAIDTSNLCANNDCRLPHQVGYYIQHSGLRCLSLRSSAVAVIPYFYKNVYLVFTVIISIIFLTLNI